MASTEIRDRRRLLRYRRLVIRRAVQMKSRVSGLLMETGVSYNKLRLHRMGYFEQLLKSSEEIPDSIRPLLRMCRDPLLSKIADTCLTREKLEEADPQLL